ETNVTAYYDPSSGKMAFAAKQTGLVNGESGNGEHIEFSDGYLTNILNITTDEQYAQSARNASVTITINGLEIEQTHTSNNFTFNGVNITLHEAGGAVTTLKVTNDTDAVVEKVK